MLRTALALGLIALSATAAHAQTPGFGAVRVGTFAPPHSSAYFTPAYQPSVVRPGWVNFDPTFTPFPVVQPSVYLNPVSPFTVADIPLINPRPPVSLPVAVRATYTTQVSPGWSIPTTIATYEPGRYVARTSWLAVNPSTGSLFNAGGNTFFRADGMFTYNPWTDRYEQPLTGAVFDPRTGVTTKPFGSPAPLFVR